MIPEMKTQVAFLLALLGCHAPEERAVAAKAAVAEVL